MFIIITIYKRKYSMFHMSVECLSIVQFHIILLLNCCHEYMIESTDLNCWHHSLLLASLIIGDIVRYHWNWALSPASRIVAGIMCPSQHQSLLLASLIIPSLVRCSEHCAL